MLKSKTPLSQFPISIIIPFLVISGVEQKARERTSSLIILAFSSSSTTWEQCDPKQIT